MLDEWLAPASVREFVQGYFGRTPHARPGAAARVVPWFDWGTLERVLERAPHDMLVAARGRLVEAPLPRNLSDVRGLMAARLGLVIRKSERYEPQLAQLAHAFADTPVGAQPDFSCIRRETSPLWGSQLIPGDWLYIPRRWWHLVHSVEDSLSISIGVLPCAPPVP